GGAGPPPGHHRHRHLPGDRMYARADGRPGAPRPAALRRRLHAARTAPAPERRLAAARRARRAAGRPVRTQKVPPVHRSPVSRAPSEGALPWEVDAGPPTSTPPRRATAPPPAPAPSPTATAAHATCTPG